MTKTAETSGSAYDALSQQLERENMVLCAAELHGMLSGLAASGALLTDDEWLALVADLANEGNVFSRSMKTLLSELDQQIKDALADPELSFQLLLPGDEELLAERLKALIQWVQSFLAGFGVNPHNLSHASEDVREAITDMTEIARLSDEVDTDEDAERAFYEVGEYVRVSAIICFNELAALKGTPTAAGSTIH